MYQSLTPGVALADNTTVRLDVNNEPQPDALLFIEPAGSGQAIVSHDDYIVGAPELVAEVAASSIDIDLGPKKEAYRRNGVKEYIVWHVPEQQIDWYVLRDDEYVSLSPESDGLLKSGVFAGLWLDAAALVRGDLARVLAVVQQGAATGEHAAFVARLAGSAN